MMMYEKQAKQKNGSGRVPRKKNNPRKNWGGNDNSGGNDNGTDDVRLTNASDKNDKESHNEDMGQRFNDNATNENTAVDNDSNSAYIQFVLWSIRDKSDDRADSDIIWSTVNTDNKRAKICVTITETEPANNNNSQPTTVLTIPSELQSELGSYWRIQ